MNYRVKKEMGCRRESDEFPTHCTCCGEHVRGDSREVILVRKGKVVKQIVCKECTYYIGW